MTKFKLPYGRGYMEAEIPEERISAVMLSKMHDYKPELSEEELVRQALKNPIGSPKLSLMAEGKDKVVVICSDHTRPVPSKIIIPQMLAEIRKGNPKADITLPINCGCHRKLRRKNYWLNSALKSWLGKDSSSRL